MEKKQRAKRQIDAYWQNRIFQICLFLAEMTLCVEILYLAVGICGLVDVGNVWIFVVRYILLPTLVNFGGVCIVGHVLKSAEISAQRKNQVVCYLAFLLSAVIQCTHYSFAETALLPCIVIIVSALFVDLKLCRNIHFISYGTLAVAAVERYIDGIVVGFPALVGFLVAAAAIYCSYQAAIILARHESVQFWLMSRSMRQKKELKEQMRIEPTTGLFSRRVLMETMERRCEDAKVCAESMQLAMVDIDNFKKINDTYGHLCGDEVLHKIGGIIKEHVHGVAEAYRYGGEEFVIIFNKDNMEDAVSIMEQIRIEMARTKFDFLEKDKITVSCGIAEYEIGMKPAEWLNRADDSLYQAKNAGKNRVIVHMQKAG